ncbi:MAG: cyclic nucleotide-binding domain-containing protein [Myxococcaceae bacterium]
MNSPVVRIELKRADVSQLVKGDPVLAACDFIKTLGRWADPIWGLSIARRFPQGTVLFQVNDGTDALMFVLRGQLRLMARKGTDMVDVGVAGPGEVAGEAEALAGGARRSSAVAAAPSDVVEIPRTAVIGLLGRCPDLKTYLESVKRKRGESLDEMTDFLNRW